MRLVLMIIFAVTLVFGSATMALAEEAECTGRMYGEHVAEHAQMHHFGGEMNPGMHQGFAGFCEHHDHSDL